MIISLPYSFLLARQLVQQVEAALPSGEIERTADRVAARELDQYSAVAEMIESAGRGAGVGRVPRLAESIAADPADPQ